MKRENKNNFNHPIFPSDNGKLILLDNSPFNKAQAKSIKCKAAQALRNCIERQFSYKEVEIKRIMVVNIFLTFRKDYIRHSGNKIELQLQLSGNIYSKHTGRICKYIKLSGML